MISDYDGLFNLVMVVSCVDIAHMPRTVLQRCLDFKRTSALLTLVRYRTRRPSRPTTRRTDHSNIVCPLPLPILRGCHLPASCHHNSIPIVLRPFLAVVHNFLFPFVLALAFRDAWVMEDLDRTFVRGTKIWRLPNMLARILINQLRFTHAAWRRVCLRSLCSSRGFKLPDQLRAGSEFRHIVSAKS